MVNSAGGGERGHLHPPFAQPDPGRRARPQSVTVEELETRVATAPAAEPAIQAMGEVSEELPSIEQFVDELPPIDQFLAEKHEPPSRSRSAPVSFPAPRPYAAPLPPETDAEGWAASDWQSYDWKGLAALGAPAPEAVEAHAAWSATKWDSAASGLRDLASRSSGLSGGEVAAALDELAQRIRSGELSLAQFQGTPPEAAIAAAFATLLRSRR
jgi:hypothetical protein